LREVIGGIADHPINRIAELLPWNIGVASLERHCVLAHRSRG
jgi:hypothetical protein